MPVSSMLPELIAAGQVPEEILRQMEAARDPALGWVQAGGPQPQFQQPPSPQQARMEEYQSGPAVPTMADIFPEPGMAQAYLIQKKGYPRNVRPETIPVLPGSEEWKLFESQQKGRKEAFELNARLRREDLAQTRESRLAEAQRRRDEATDARMRRLEEGRPLTTSELRDVRTDLENIDTAQVALDLLEGKNVGGKVGDRNATGWKGLAPDFILQRADPMGVDARAALSNIGSLRAQERSGGAIPAQEWQRIAGFIPTETDDPVTARKKLRQFIEEYQRALRVAMDVYEGRKVPTKLRQRIEGRARPSLREIFNGGN